MELITKSQLLETKYVVDNEYLDKYVSLINLHRSDPKVVRKTHTHHIIPVSYYTSNKLDVNNSKSNLVNLTYKDHMLAHLYLSGCTQGRNRYKNLYSLFQLSHFDKEGYLDIQNYDRYQQLYEEAISAAPNHRKGTKCSAETKAKMSIASKLKVEKNGGAYNKGSVWVTDGNIDKMIPADELESYLNRSYALGRTYRHNSETIAKISESGKHRVITDEFRQKMRELGRLSNIGRDPESYKKQGRFMHEYYKSHDNPFKGKHHSAESNEKNRLAHLGRIKIVKDNVVKAIFPSDLDAYVATGWVLKKAKEKEVVTETGMIFITNGVINKKINMSELVEWKMKGFRRGLVKRHTTK